MRGEPFFNADLCICKFDQTSRIYYQLSPDRVSACPVTIHAILHIPDSIEASGPVWVSWAFPTERYCGSLVPAIRSRRFPFPSLDRYIAELAQLTQIKMLYNLEEILSLQVPKGDVAGLFSNPACEFKFLLTFELIVILTSLILFILIIMCVKIQNVFDSPPAFWIHLPLFSITKLLFAYQLGLTYLLEALDSI